MKFKKGYSETNIETILACYKWLKNHYDISVIDESLGNRVWSEMAELGRLPTTIVRRLVALELIAEHRGKPVKLSRPKMMKPVTGSLSVAEARAMIAAADNVRDLAIIRLLLGTGIRSGELLRLNREDVDLKEATVHVVKAKNGCSRKLVLDKETLGAMRSWLDVMPEDAPGLWVNRYGQRLSKSGFDKIIRRLAKRAGVKCSAHKCRHTFCNVALRSGVALQAGHRSINTTVTMYLHGDLASLRASLNRTKLY